MATWWGWTKFNGRRKGPVYKRMREAMGIPEQCKRFFADAWKPLLLPERGGAA